MPPIIEITGLSKQYHIGKREPYKTLRDAIVNTVTSPLRWFNRNVANEDNAIWALKDVSFTVNEGEVLGIIGRNGAGKSTLLKILSRITEPTEGEIKIRGRVGSLLEVGTGFHPELTGRENIFLNGAILGMRREEIKKKFDEIVAFAEIEKFLDTPVKRYSSGMYVRLAFAVAAHLEPEILVIDEVLAVGDAQFQKKCMGKMGEVAKGGRTVLFVSHNMQAIRQLCSRAIVLRSGKMSIDSESSKAVEYYMQNAENVKDTKTLEEMIKNIPPDPVFRLENITLTQNGQTITQFVENGKPLEIQICYRVFEKTTGLRVYFDLCDDQDTLLFRSFHDEDNDGIPIVEPGEYISKVVIPANLLGPIKYEIKILSGIFNVRSCMAEPVCIPIYVENTGHYNRAYLGDTFRGKFAFSAKWETEKYINT